MIRRQLAGYVLVGVSQVALDWIVFVVVTSLGVPVVAANILSRSLSAVLGFWANGRYTFATDASPTLGKRELVRYAASWSLMAVISTVALHFVEATAGLRLAWFLKPAIDIFLAGLGFLVSKYWIYQPR